MEGLAAVLASLFASAAQTALIDVYDTTTSRVALIAASSQA